MTFDGSLFIELELKEQKKYELCIPLFPVKKRWSMNVCHSLYRLNKCLLRFEHVQYLFQKYTIILSIWFFNIITIFLTN